VKAQAHPAESSQDTFSSDEFCIQAPLIKKYSSLSQQLSVNVDYLSFGSSESIQTS